MLRARRLLRSFDAFGSEQAALLDVTFRQLRLAGVERQSLLRPYRRAWRWYRHPLAVAYRESHRRRTSS